MLYAAVDAWKPFGLGCAVFRRAVCGRALCAARSGMMFTMALWLAVYPLYIALASHSAAQRKWNTLWLPLVHPALYALGVWLVFHTVPELAYCAGYLAVGYGFWGAGWGMKRRRQRRGRQGPNKDFQ